MKGTIKKLMSDRSYGFITIEGEEKDLFFHQSGVKANFSDLKIGDEVEFDMEETDRGPQAVNVDTV